MPGTIAIAHENPSSHAAHQHSRYEGREQGEWIDLVETNKAQYIPGDTVSITLTFYRPVNRGDLHVIYRHLNQQVGERTDKLSITDNFSWIWQTPDKDYKGYMIEVHLMSGDTVLDHANIAVDVSSDWKRFPRYGFVSKYPAMEPGEIEDVISRLNRYHINGLQFYDWHHKHHMPLKGTPEDPAPTWNDIANRINHFTTVAAYIDAANRRNMKSMAYDLLYGSWSNADADGVSSVWRLFLDPNHEKPKVLDFTEDWAADIYIMDPSNPSWKDYIIANMGRAFLALHFDGWHVDQLGNMGDLWNYQGEAVSVKDGFVSFLEQTKRNLNVNLVMNSVNQYGQPEIATCPVDFLYTEVWDPNKTYVDLARIINNNWTYSGGGLNTVLAAYVNHDLSESPGTFNAPAVLLADAVIFAAGGAHIELGEHMLGHEYFPNNNLIMSEELKQQIVQYYDFLVAYENLLRDNVTVSSLQISTSDPVSIKSWPQLGAIWEFAKEKDKRQIIHLINFVDATTLDWRDNQGTQIEPDTIKNLSLWFETEQDVKSIWIASPDFYQGSPIEIAYTQENGRVLFTLPWLKYWDMIVVEYESAANPIEEIENTSLLNF